MKLSVIVPSLDGTVPESLREQLVGCSDIELIVVAGVHPVGKARNEGLRRAHGEYVAWVDSDDEVTDDWLAEIRTSVEHEPDVVLFDAKPEGWSCMGDFTYRGEGGALAPEQLVRDVYENRRVQGHLFRIVSRRRLWTGLWFDESVPALEDFLLLPQVLMRANGVWYHPYILYRYIRHPGSVMTLRDPVNRLADAEAAIRRWRESPPEFKQAALRGSLVCVYDSLLILALDVRGLRKIERLRRTRTYRHFLLRHCWRSGLGLHVLLRQVLAGVDCWLLQRLMKWYHFDVRVKQAK